jgi:hypothetical protein
MKSFFVILIAALCFTTATAALVGTNTISYGAIAGTVSTPATNSGNAFRISNVVVPGVTYLVQNGGFVTATNALRLDIQFSFDQSNWTTLTNYYPATTNSTVDSFVPQLNPMTIYVRARAVTTNTISVGVTAVTTQ